MPRYIVKLHEHYLEFSTIVDAPVTWGMSRAEFEDYYRQKYGEIGMNEFPARMKRVDETGTSEMGSKSVYDTMRFNRAGPNERCLSVKQIYESHCLMRPIQLRGKKWKFDEAGRWQRVTDVTP